MRSKPFHFKRFTVVQEGSSHKVGTDGVLLGAWVQMRMKDTHILDVGTGTGLIALMLAQRTPPEVQIDAIDIGKQEVQLARENIKRSPWPNRVTVHEAAVQNFYSGSFYDLVVSNPPYFVNSLAPPDQRRSASRHTVKLPFEELLASALNLLAPEGRLAVILPHAEGLQFLKMGVLRGLHPLRKTIFRARADKPPERLLVELSRGVGRTEESEIVLYAEGGSWSDEYIRLTRDFYIKN